MGHHNDKAGQEDGTEYARAGIAPSITFRSRQRHACNFQATTTSKLMIPLIQVCHTTILRAIHNIQENQLM